MMNEVNESAPPPRVDRRIAARLSNLGSRAQALIVVVSVIAFLSLLIFLLVKNREPTTTIRSSNLETTLVVAPANIGVLSGVTASGALVGVSGSAGAPGGGSTFSGIGGGASTGNNDVSGSGGTPGSSQKGAGFVLIIPPTPAVINLVSVHATAEAAFARTPGARSSGIAAPKPASVQAATAGAPAKTLVVSGAKPVGQAPDAKPGAPISEASFGRSPDAPNLGAPSAEKPKEIPAPMRPVQSPEIVISPISASPAPGEQGVAAIKTIIAARTVSGVSDANTIGGDSTIGVEEPVATTIPSATVVPPATRTPTTTRTATVTETSTPTPTTTSTPGPCEATATIPFMSPGYGFFVTFIHEAPGGLRVLWKVVDGSITVFEKKPGTFGDEASGSVLGVPADRPIGQGNSGTLAVNVYNKAAGPYTVYFFNGSQSSISPSAATVTFTTIGHCP